MKDRLRFRPTPTQYREFGGYLCRAHSWYKHLPLMGGRRFVVFVAPDAGTGNVILDLTRGEFVTPEGGSDFTEEHPRLHYGWQTTKEYRSRFGYLDYMRRGAPGERYRRDAGPPVHFPDSVEERCSFVLYPYVSWEFAEAVTWDVHEEAVEQLRGGAAHPARDKVLKLARPRCGIKR